MYNYINQPILKMFENTKLEIEDGELPLDRFSREGVAQVGQ